MRDSIKYVLLSEGSSDQILLPILQWILEQHLPRTAINSMWADLRYLRRPPKNLSERVLIALELFPCDILFIHRDADGETIAKRSAEILSAVELARKKGQETPYICVIPVRMTEAWLLTDEKAVRHAAGNPCGNMPLRLPPVKELESIVDPKEVLYSLLRTASNLNSRRLKNFKPAKEAHNVAEYINDFSPLRQLSAFQHLEVEIIKFTATL